MLHCSNNALPFSFFLLASCLYSHTILYMTLWHWHCFGLYSYPTMYTKMMTLVSSSMILACIFMLSIVYETLICSHFSWFFINDVVFRILTFWYFSCLYSYGKVYVTLACWHASWLYSYATLCVTLASWYASYLYNSVTMMLRHN